jgi:hypothetical protein
MKTKALFFALLVMAGTTAFGNDAPGLTVVSLKSSGIFKVIYKGSERGRVKLNILDNGGKTIHTETISDVDGFIVPVNFNGLRAGEYFIEVVDNSGKHREQVSYRPTADLKSVHVSKLAGIEDKYLFSVADAQDEPIQVRIYDNLQRVIFAESKVLSGDFAQVFNLLNNTGSCTFEVSDATGNKKYFTFQ